MTKKNPMPNYKEQIKEMISQHYNVKDVYKDNTVEKNKSICEAQSLPFAVGACNVMGDLNIGIIIRTASLLGAEGVYLFGRKKYDRRSTVGAENYISLHFEPELNLDDILKNGFPYPYQPVFVEAPRQTVFVEGGKSCKHWSIHHMNSSNWRIILAHSNYPPMFLFGSESTGFNCSDETFNEISHLYPVISIPQRGVLRSYNVSSAMSIVTYEYVRDFI